MKSWNKLTIMDYGKASEASSTNELYAPYVWYKSSHSSVKLKKDNCFKPVLLPENYYYPVGKLATKNIASALLKTAANLIKSNVRH